MTFPINDKSNGKWQRSKGKNGRAIHWRCHLGGVIPSAARNLALISRKAEKSRVEELRTFRPSTPRLVSRARFLAALGMTPGVRGWFGERHKSQEEEVEHLGPDE